MEESRTKEDADSIEASVNIERRKRINRYKKMILRFLMILIVITVILWIYIIFMVNRLENRIDALNLSMISEIRRIII